MRLYGNLDRDRYSFTPEPGLVPVEDAALRADGLSVHVFVLPSLEKAAAFTEAAVGLFHEAVFGFGLTYSLDDGRVALVFIDRSEEFGERCRKPGLHYHGV